MPMHITPPGWEGPYQHVLSCYHNCIFLLHTNYIHCYSIYFYIARHSIPFTMDFLHTLLLLSRILLLLLFNQLDAITHF